MSRSARFGSCARSRVLVGLLCALGLVAWNTSSALAAPPTVTIDPNPTIGYTIAHVSGTVDTHGEEVNVYAESATAGSEEFKYLFITTITAGTSGATPVSGEIPGLKPGTEYLFRLNAEVSGMGETKNPAAVSGRLHQTGHRADDLHRTGHDVRPHDREPERPYRSERAGTRTGLSRRRSWLRGAVAFRMHPGMPGSLWHGGGRRKHS
jgi:hypothetical protein